MSISFLYFLILVLLFVVAGDVIVRLVDTLVRYLQRCRCINNFATMTAIISGLNLTPVRRLKRSWELVAPKYISQFEVCEAIMNPDKNFSNYWTTLSQCVPPCIPFIGTYRTIFLTLVTFADGARPLSFFK